MNVLETAAAISFAAGLIALLLALRVLRRRRPLVGGLGALAAASLLAAGLVLAAAGVNLHTYQRLSYEREVARLQFKQLAPRHYAVLLWGPEQRRARRYELRGDQWQLDARVLKWHGLAAVVGLDSYYRLERLSGRYRDLERERAAPRTVHALAGSSNIDLWQLAQRHSRRLPWLDAIYGSAAYLPMVHGGEFSVHLGQSGLIARPANPAARRATAGWPAGAGSR